MRNPDIGPTDKWPEENPDDQDRLAAIALWQAIGRIPGMPKPSRRRPAKYSAAIRNPYQLPPGVQAYLTPGASEPPLDEPYSYSYQARLERRADIPSNGVGSVYFSRLTGLATARRIVSVRYTVHTGGPRTPYPAQPALFVAKGHRDYTVDTNGEMDAAAIEALSKEIDKENIAIRTGTPIPDASEVDELISWLPTPPNQES
ncbi:MAG TPA: hypothetical protein VMB52_02440 [Verrucomicrobiae bacterium]|nr:hypothetical protein [Verrucomicrobiae bacterium]